MDPTQEAEALRRLVIENGLTNLEALQQIRSEQKGREIAARLNAQRTTPAPKPEEPKKP